MSNFFIDLKIIYLNLTLKLSPSPPTHPSTIKINIHTMFSFNFSNCKASHNAQNSNPAFNLKVCYVLSKQLLFKMKIYKLNKKTILS